MNGPFSAVLFVSQWSVRATLCTDVATKMDFIDTLGFFFFFYNGSIKSAEGRQLAAWFWLKGSRLHFNVSYYCDSTNKLWQRATKTVKYQKVVLNLW